MPTCDMCNGNCTCGKLNNIGYPHDDPYGLIAAFWRAFGGKEKNNESNNTKQKKRTNPKTRKISRRSL